MPTCIMLYVYFQASSNDRPFSSPVLVSRPLPTLPAKPPSRPAPVPPRPKIQPINAAQSSGPSLLNGTSSASRTDLAPAASDSATGEKGRPAVDDKAVPAMDERRAVVKRNVAPWRKQQHTGEESTAVEAAATTEDIYEFSGRYRYLRVRTSSDVDPHYVDADADPD
jgi:hypothetical protein